MEMIWWQTILVFAVKAAIIVASIEFILWRILGERSEGEAEEE